MSFTFDQVEAILGEPLPLAAYLQPGWWISGVRRGHGAPWTAIGWRVEQVDPYAGTITFARSEAAPDG